ncbi:MAG: hypothetical protein AAGD96_20140, partial [Chloroflexota bacterium]
IGFLFSLCFLFIITACGLEDSDEQVLDFGNTSQALVAQEFKGGREEQKPGGIEEGGLQLTKVSGHNWTLIYDHPTQIATLKVGIVSWDEERYTLTDIHYNCEYEYDDATVNGDEVILELIQTKNGVTGGLRGAIEDCYDRSTIAPLNGFVPPVESYPAVQFETIGKWEEANRGQLIKHPSFDYYFDANKDDVTIRLDADRGTLNGGGSTNNRDIQSKSNPFNVANNKGAPFHAASYFEFWISLFDAPQGRMNYVEHYFWDQNGDVFNFTPKQKQDAEALRIVLEPTEMIITPPGGFELEKFIVDPKRFGTGGGG